MQGHPVEYLHLGPAFDGQPLDDVEAVQLDLCLGETGQVPATGWGWAARPLAAVQCATPAKDAVDSPHRGQQTAAALLEGLVNECRANGAQVAVGQFPADLQDKILQGGIGATGVVRGRGAVGPIDTVEALAFGSLDPEGDGADADAELPGDSAERLALADGGYHVPTTLIPNSR